MSAIRRLVLASTSPRRRALLAQAGFSHDASGPGVDDGLMRIAAGISPEHWTVGLAYLKARAASRKFFGDGAAVPSSVVLLSADTIVVKDGQVIGQPANEEAAQRTIERLENGSHRVLTGVAILTSERRRVLVDEARVRVGPIGAVRIAAYIASGDWRGKAGGYNLSERLADGWPIEFEGDPGTIMGLPMHRLAPILRRLLVQGDRPDRPADPWHSEEGGS